MISKELKAEYDRAYYIRNKSKKQAQARAWNQANRDDQCAKKRARYRAKRDEIAQYMREPKRLEYARINAKNQKAKRRRASKYRPLSVWEWRQIVDMHAGMCVYCNARPAKLTAEHVDPLSRGGAHVSENIVTACASCNSKKNNATLLEFMRRRLMDERYRGAA